MAEGGNGNSATAPSNSVLTEFTARLWEACVEAEWSSVDVLCDEYVKAKEKDNGVHDGAGGDKLSDTKNRDIDWSDDASLFRTIENIGEINRRNPLMAAVLHVAIDLAAAHGSFSLFSDVVARDLVDAEERKRLRSGGLVAFDDPLTALDFCPYIQMAKYSDDNHPLIDGEHRRARRRAIARMCRAEPLWIVLPMIPWHRNRYEEDSNFDDDLPRGTTPLHVAVRSRNITLTRLLVKYCPKAAEIADVDGCIPLHYAARPRDETTVLRRAVLTYQRSLNEGAENAPLEVGPNEAHSGINLYYYGKLLFKATQESCDLARCRVRRLRQKHKLRTLSANVARMKSLKLANTAGIGNTRSSSSNQTRDSPNEKSDGNKQASKNVHSKDEKGELGPRKIEGRNKEDCTALLNMYDTPALLVRAMMRLGTIEEDATDLVESEWNIREDSSDERLEARKSTISTEYPVVVDSTRTVTHGLSRATRPWKSERHRTDVVKLLGSSHPQGIMYQCDDGGDTPLIIGCQTLEGDDDGDEDDIGDLIDMGDDQVNERPGRNMNAPVQDQIGEDAADYEMDLPRQPDEANVKATGAVDAAQQLNNEAPAGQNDDGEEGDDERPGPNNGEEDPLEAVLFMVAGNGSNAVGLPNDNGDTALHAATRIGASPRLVQQLLNTMPALASTPAEDGSTPLHLACRRASHLAPEGNGGMGTYGAAEIRMLADAAGPGALSAADDEGRTPFHVACRFRASPTVLSELADSAGGGNSLLIRDAENHTPLGVYCRHATDYHGLRVLVERCPEAAAAMGDGRHLPLHRILANFNLAVNVDCLKLLGTAYPRGLDAVDARGLTPLAHLCESYRGPLNVDIPKLRDGRTTLERCLSNKIWLMARYLVLAASSNRRLNAQTNEDETAIGASQLELVLHATLRDPSSSAEIVQLSTMIHSDQIRETDHNDDTPLHLCCMRRSGQTRNTRSENDESSTVDTLSNDSLFNQVNEGIVVNENPINLESISLSREANSDRQRQYNPHRDYLPILYHVLKLDMSAAGLPNKNGKYPLNLLIDKGSTWKNGGVDRVLKASPQALFSYELSNSLFAMVLARTASYEVCSNPDRLLEEQASSIGATFQLLRGKPTALEGANLNPVSSKRSAKVRRSKRARTK